LDRNNSFGKSAPLHEYLASAEVLDVLETYRLNDTVTTHPFIGYRIYEDKTERKNAIIQYLALRVLKETVVTAINYLKQKKKLIDVYDPTGKELLGSVLVETGNESLSEIRAKLINLKAFHDYKFNFLDKQFQDIPEEDEPNIPCNQIETERKEKKRYFATTIRVFVTNVSEAHTQNKIAEEIREEMDAWNCLLYNCYYENVTVIKSK